VKSLLRQLIASPPRPQQPPDNPPRIISLSEGAEPLRPFLF
jgi:hypothetical protein